MKKIILHFSILLIPCFYQTIQAAATLKKGESALQGILSTQSTDMPSFNQFKVSSTEQSLPIYIWGNGKIKGIYTCLGKTPENYNYGIYMPYPITVVESGSGISASENVHGATKNIVASFTNMQQTSPKNSGIVNLLEYNIPINKIPAKKIDQPVKTQALSANLPEEVKPGRMNTSLKDESKHTQSVAQEAIAMAQQAVALAQQASIAAHKTAKNNHDDATANIISSWEGNLNAAQQALLQASTKSSNLFSV
jgi:hypothetical protein